MNNLITAPGRPPALPTIHIGSPTDVGALTIFPVWTDAPLAERPMQVGLPDGASI